MLRSQKRMILVVALASIASVGCGSTSPSVAPTTTVAAPAAPVGHQLLAAADADALLRQPPVGLVVLDVRTPAEFAAGHLARAVDLDLQSGTFETQVATLDRRVPYFVYCHSGHRSAQAVAIMQRLGFAAIDELQGGIEAWVAAGLPVVSS